MQIMQQKIKLYLAKAICSRPPCRFFKRIFCYSCNSATFTEHTLPPGTKMKNEEYRRNRSDVPWLLVHVCCVGRTLYTGLLYYVSTVDAVY